MKHIIKFSEYLKEEIKINEELVSSNPANVRNELIKVIGSGNVDSIDKFMDENNIDANYDSGMILRLAAKQGNLDLVKYLAEVGGDFSIRRNLALKTALAYGKSEVAKYLLDEYELTTEDIESVEEYILSSDEVSVGEKRAATSLLSQYK